MQIIWLHFFETRGNASKGIEATELIKIV